MVASVNFQILSFAIPDGDSRIVTVRGEFFHVVQSTHEFDVIIDDNGRASGVSEGLGWRARAGETFDRLRIENQSGAAIDIRIAVGFGDFIDARVQLSTALKVGASAASFDYSSVSVGAAAAQISAANADRTRALIRAGGADLWLGPDNTVTATGPATVLAGEVLQVLHRGAIYGIRAAGSMAVGFLEETE